MKNRIIVITSVLMFVGCVSSKKMRYEFPAAMTETTKKEFLRQCEKGEVLFDINCAKCHTQKTRSGIKIEDFTSAQIYGYDIRMSNAKHETEISANTVTTEELGYIMSFLMYKKRSGLQHKSSHPD